MPENKDKQEKSFEESLRYMYRHLINQLDQKVGREKQILRKYIRALDARIRQKRE